MEPIARPNYFDRCELLGTGRFQALCDARWPAAGFVDTKIGCFMKPEVVYAAKTVWA